MATQINRQPRNEQTLPFGKVAKTAGGRLKPPKQKNRGTQ